MTELIYLTDSYKKELKAKVVSCKHKGQLWLVVLDKTIFYPEGGGQPSDRGEIVGKKGNAHVKHVRLSGTDVVHECTLDGVFNFGDTVTCYLDWQARYHNMRVHSAGHIVHEAVMQVAFYLEPLKGSHGDHAFIEYKGSITQDKKYQIEQKANDIVSQNLPISTEFVTLDQLQARASYIPEHLPSNKPLRIVAIKGFEPIPDGGTQVIKTGEVGPISVDTIDNEDDLVRVNYSIEHHGETTSIEKTSDATSLIAALLDVEKETVDEIRASDQSVDELKIRHLGRSSELSKLTSQLGSVPKIDRQRVGLVTNQVKKHIEAALSERTKTSRLSLDENWIDVTAPGIRPPEGHLHIVSQAITEITRIFERIGFTRVRHPEVDWDWYAFESLNMPPNHPARDEWETFFIGLTGSHPVRKQGETLSDKYGQIVLSPHTSNGQVREMEKGKLPIRMINIAKCYRRQLDVSHTPMFHQFEGLYVDKDVSIGDLKGVMDFFFKNYYGAERVSRLRPFHFQFTEPSFEVDINCGVCLGKGCKLCKDGWLELGGSGMVHPNVLRSGGIDPNVYSGFAFGWGIERVAMMKSGTKLDDVRLLYSNDVRFLEQF